MLASYHKTLDGVLCRSGVSFRFKRTQASGINIWISQGGPRSTALRMGPGPAIGKGNETRRSENKPPGQFIFSPGSAFSGLSTCLVDALKLSPSIRQEKFSLIVTQICLYATLPYLWIWFYSQETDPPPYLRYRCSAALCYLSYALEISSLHPQKPCLSQTLGSNCCRTTKQQSGKPSDPKAPPPLLRHPVIACSL